MKPPLTPCARPAVLRAPGSARLRSGARAVSTHAGLWPAALPQRSALGRRWTVFYCHSRCSVTGPCGGRAALYRFPLATWRSVFMRLPEELWRTGNCLAFSRGFRGVGQRCRAHRALPAAPRAPLARPGHASALPSAPPSGRGRVLRGLCCRRCPAARNALPSPLIRCLSLPAEEVRVSLSEPLEEPFPVEQVQVWLVSVLPYHCVMSLCLVFEVESPLCVLSLVCQPRRVTWLSWGATGHPGPGPPLLLPRAVLGTRTLIPSAVTSGLSATSAVQPGPRGQFAGMVLPGGGDCP